MKINKINIKESDVSFNDYSNDLGISNDQMAYLLKLLTINKELVQNELGIQVVPQNASEISSEKKNTFLEILKKLGVDFTAKITSNCIFELIKGIT